ncbi:MAG: metal-dependent hydrolase, partial [Aeoliella sp.]
MQTPPDNPAGPFEHVESFDDGTKAKLIEVVQQAPARLREAVAGLTDPQLDTLYKNWTIRQITHHIADSHLHS